MWLMKAPKDVPKDGEIYNQVLVNGHCLVATQYYWNLLTYLGFEDVTPPDWPRARRKKDLLERVVFQHQGGIGDMLFTTVAYEAYRRAYPNIFIEVATSAVGSQLLSYNPNIHKFSLDESLKHLFARMEQYDDAITFDCMLAGLSESSIKNVYDIVLDWAGVDLPIEDRVPNIYLQEKEIADMKYKLNKIGIGPNEKFIAMQPESSTNSRNIKLDTAFEVAELLVLEGYKVVMFGTLFPGTILRKRACSCGKIKYTQFTEEINTATIKCGCGQEVPFSKTDEPVNSIYVIAGWNMREIAAMIRQSKGIIGIDSCGVHTGAALRKPSLGLYSSFDGDLRMRYYPTGSWIQKPYRCAPCFVHHIDCRWRIEMGLKVPPCMDQFTAQEIVDAFKGLKYEVDNSLPVTKPGTFVPINTIKTCPICGDSRRAFVARKGSVLYYDCNSCKTTYADSVPDNINYYSDKQYWNCYKRQEYRDSEKSVAHTVTEAFQKKFNYRGSLLEIGPGTGGVLSELKRLGWDTTGIEASSLFPELAQELGNENVIPDVIIGDFMTWETDKKFDVVCFHHSLEHFPDIKAALLKGISLLNEGGVFDFLIPATDVWQKFDNRWGHINGYMPGEHSIMMTKNQFIWLLDSIGLEHQVFGENVDKTGTLWIVAQRKKPK